MADCSNTPTPESTANFDLDSRCFSEAMTSNSDYTTARASDGNVKKTFAAALREAGQEHVGEWSTNPLVTESNQVIPYAGTNQLFRPLSLPYQVDSATHPNPNDLLPDPSTGYAGELVDVSQFSTETTVSKQITDTSVIEFTSVQTMKTGTTIGGRTHVFSVGQRLSTGATSWTVQGTAALVGGYVDLGNGLGAVPNGAISLTDAGVSVNETATNNSAYIDEMLDVAKAGSGGEVFADAGVFEVNKEISVPNGVYFRGVTCAFPSSSGTTFKYVGAQAHMESLLRVSTTKVGTISTTSMNARVENINLDCNDLIGFGVYASYLMRLSNLNNIFVTHATVCGFYLLKSWYARVGRIFSAYHGQIGVNIGYRMFNETVGSIGEEATNGMRFDEIISTAGRNVSVGVLDPSIEADISGYGLVFRTTACNFGQLTVAGNAVGGIIDTCSYSNSIDSIYTENQPETRGPCYRYETYGSQRGTFISQYCFKGSGQQSLECNAKGLVIGVTSSDEEMDDPIGGSEKATIMFQSFKAGRTRNTESSFISSQLVGHKNNVNWRYSTEGVRFANLTGQPMRIYCAIIPNTTVNLSSDLFIRMDDGNNTNFGRNFTEGDMVIRSLGNSENLRGYIRPVSSGSTDVDFDVMVYSMTWGFDLGNMSYVSFPDI